MQTVPVNHLDVGSPRWTLKRQRSGGEEAELIRRLRRRFQEESGKRQVHAGHIEAALELACDSDSACVCWRSSPFFASASASCSRTSSSAT